MGNVLLCLCCPHQGHSCPHEDGGATPFPFYFTVLIVYFLVIEIKFVFRAQLVILSIEMEGSVHGLTV